MYLLLVYEVLKRTPQAHLQLHQSIGSSSSILALIWTWLALAANKSRTSGLQMCEQEGEWTDISQCSVKIIHSQLVHFHRLFGSCFKLCLGPPPTCSVCHFSKLKVLPKWPTYKRPCSLSAHGRNYVSFYPIRGV